MSVVGIFSCEINVPLLGSTFDGERLRRVGVREGVLGFRCVFGLLCFGLGLWLSLLDCVFLCAEYQMFSWRLKCSMWNTAMAPEVVVVPGRASSVTSYCDVGSQEVSESSVSGEAEYSSTYVYSSEVVHAAFSLRGNSLYFITCTRVDHPTGFFVITPFLLVHCFSTLGIFRFLDKGVRVILLGLSQKAACETN